MYLGCIVPNGTGHRGTGSFNNDTQEGAYGTVYRKGAREQAQESFPIMSLGSGRRSVAVVFERFIGIF